MTTEQTIERLMRYIARARLEVDNAFFERERMDKMLQAHQTAIYGLNERLARLEGPAPLKLEQDKS